MKQTIKKVLLVDDDEDELFFFQNALKEVDPTIEVNFLSHPDQLPKDGKCIVPDLLFLDINMPSWDGFKWLEKIRNKHVDVPVVMYSTSKNKTNINKAYTSGANLYMTKPDRQELLISSLRNILQFNWSHPEAIKQQFFKDGRYEAFVPSKN